MNKPIVAVMTMTTVVAPINSSLVDQATLDNSPLASFKKLIGLLIIAIILSSFIDYIFPGAAGVEPAVTVLETVGLPLTDAPINLMHSPKIKNYFISL